MTPRNPTKPAPRTGARRADPAGRRARSGGPGAGHAADDPAGDAEAAAALPLAEQVRIWAERSDDKPDVGRGLARVLRVLTRALPPDEPLRALAIGPSTEPQRRLLHACCEGGTTLLDVDGSALDAFRRRAARQGIEGFTTARADYREVLASRASAARFRDDAMGGRRAHAVLLHHSLYYAPAADWRPLAGHAWAELVAPVGALHAVLMAARTDDEATTTALYARHAGRWFGHVNDQCLRAFAASLADDPAFADAAPALRTSRVAFRPGSFRDLMAAVWMILLHTHVHRFPPEAVRSVEDDVRRRFWDAGRPLVQEQDHLALFRGIGAGEARV